MAEVVLSRGRVAVIDDEDAPLVGAFKWYATPNPMGGYYATTRIKKADGKGTTLYMHRLIVGAPKGKEVDHYNHNTLDNRRDNLKVGSHKDNMRNGKFALATHCPRGHIYDEKNTYVDNRGRRCRMCARLRQREILANETREQKQQRRRKLYLRNYENERKQQKLYAAKHKEEKREYDRLYRLEKKKHQ